VGKALRLNTRPRDRVQNGKIPRYKDELIVTAKISTGFAEAPLSRNAMQADDGEEAPPPSSPTAPSGSKRCAACPVGLASHGSSSEHVGGNEMSLLTGGILFVLTISQSTSPSVITALKKKVFSERFKIKSYMAKRTNLGLNLDKWHDLHFFDYEGSRLKLAHFD